MSKQRDYDSTVARIAGNIAAGLAGKPDIRCSDLGDVDGLADWAQSVVLLSVGLARGIVREVRRTEAGEPKE